MTTSGFRKRTTAVLKFYFRFQLSHFRCHRRAILRRPSMFHLRRAGSVIHCHCFILKSWAWYDLCFRK